MKWKVYPLRQNVKNVNTINDCIGAHTLSPFIITHLNHHCNTVFICKGPTPWRQRNITKWGRGYRTFPRHWNISEYTMKPIQRFPSWYRLYCILYTQQIITWYLRSLVVIIMMQGNRARGAGSLQWLSKFNWQHSGGTKLTLAEKVYLIWIDRHSTRLIKWAVAPTPIQFQQLVASLTVQLISLKKVLMCHSFYCS